MYGDTYRSWEEERRTLHLNFCQQLAPAPRGNACVWQLQLYFWMGDFGMHGGQLHKSLQTFCQAMLTASQYTKCEWYGLFVFYGCWSSYSSPRPAHWKAKTPWLIQLMFGLSLSSLSHSSSAELPVEFFWRTSLIIRHVSQSRQLNFRI